MLKIDTDNAARRARAPNNHAYGVESGLAQASIRKSSQHFPSSNLTFSPLSCAKEPGTSQATYPPSRPASPPPARIRQCDARIRGSRPGGLGPGVRLPHRCRCRTSQARAETRGGRDGLDVSVCLVGDGVYLWRGDEEDAGGVR